MIRNANGEINIVEMLLKTKSALAKLLSIIENNMQIKVLEQLKSGKLLQCDLEKLTFISKAELQRQLVKMIENQIVIATPIADDYATKFHYSLSPYGMKIAEAFKEILPFAIKYETLLDEINEAIRLAEEKKRGEAK